MLSRTNDANAGSNGTLVRVRTRDMDTRIAIWDLQERDMVAKKESRYYDAKEKMSLSKRQSYYNQSLVKMVRLGYQKSSRVKKIFDERNIDPLKIRSIKDLEKLPVISREQLVKLEKEEPPYGGFSPKNVMTDRIFTSPGPVYEPHLTEKDPIWGKGYYAAGFRKGDIVT